MAYFIGGFTWGENSQLERFLEEGIWENGWKEGEYQDLFDTISKGDYFALKSTFRKGEKSWLRIQRIGRIINRVDDRTLKVHWFSNLEFELTDIGWYADTLMKIENKEHLVRIFGKLIEEENMNNMIKLLKSKHQIILQGAPGTGKTYTAKNIAEEMIFNTVSKDKTEQSNKLEKSNQFKLIQFHPSYTYEDFVRGIVVDTNDSSTPQYITKNKILGEFAAEALLNYEDSKKAQDVVSKENWLNKQFEEFVNTVIDKIDLANDYEITDNVSIVSVDENAFRYKGREGWSIKGNRMLFKDIKKAYLDDNIERQNIKHNQNLSGLARWHASYYVRVLADFREYLKTNNIIYTPTKSSKREVLNYVLIIDEINRANLPAVLGELIYALEYRGEAVESMYKLDEGDNRLVLPPNLYIIGTMNTADRSVGHIDYAIRRRFAFVDVKAEILSDDMLPDGCTFSSDLFKKVSALFTEKDNTDSYKYLSQEFEPEDVQLGHSYFITSDKNPIEMRLEYEIKPILREYVRDGILKESTREIINGL